MHTLCKGLSPFSVSGRAWASARFVCRRLTWGATPCEWAAVRASTSHRDAYVLVIADGRSDIRCSTHRARFGV